MGFQDYWDLALTVIKGFKIRSQRFLKKNLHYRSIDQGISVEATVVQNQGTIPKKGCNLFREPFFVSFLGEQKRKI